MNMKKTIAGVLASVVAVSAMATVAVSAATTNQAEGSKVIDISKKGWQAFWELESSYTKKDGTIAFVNSDAGTFYFKVTSGSNANADIGDIKLTIKGTTGDSAGSVATKTSSYTLKYDEVLGYKYTIVTEGVSKKGDINLGEYSSINSVTLSATVNSEEYLVEKNAKTRGEDPSAHYSVAGFIAGNTFDLYAPEGDYKKMDNEGIEFTVNKSGVSMNNLKEGLGYTIVNEIGNKKGAKIILTFAADDEMGEIEDDTYDQELDYAEVEGTIKDLALAPAISSKMTTSISGSEITYQYSPIWSNNVRGNADIIDGTTAEFDWDKIVNESGLKINSFGIINDVVLGHKESKTLKLEKVVVKWPATSFDDLSAGEGQDESEEVITTTEAAAEVTTTDAAEVTTTEATPNPTTGNAPIALAVIPVAIAAAAIVAKKRG